MKKIFALFLLFALSIGVTVAQDFKTAGEFACTGNPEQWLSPAEVKAMVASLALLCTGGGGCSNGSDEEFSVLAANKVSESTKCAIERAGMKYLDADGKETDIFAMLKASGVNMIRLRIWNDTSKDTDASKQGNNNLEVTKALAKRAAARLKI